MLLAARTADALHVAVLDDPPVIDGHNLAGEPRGSIAFELPVDLFASVRLSVAEELVRRGAWARCTQTVGVLDAAADLTVAHTRERLALDGPVFVL